MKHQATAGNCHVSHKALPRHRWLMWRNVWGWQDWGALGSGGNSSWNGWGKTIGEIKGVWGREEGWPVTLLTVLKNISGNSMWRLLCQSLIEFSWRALFSFRTAITALHRRRSSAESESVWCRGEVAEGCVWRSKSNTLILENTTSGGVTNTFIQDGC